MKKRLLLVCLGISIVMLAAVFIFYIQTTKSPLPDSAKINIYGGWSSSGGSRNYNSTLVFSEGRLTEGSQTYEYWSSNEHKIYECIIDLNTQSWINKTGNGPCPYNSSFIPTTLGGLREKINLGELKPNSQCFHLDTCYQILM